MSLEIAVKAPQFEFAAKVEITLPLARFRLPDIEVDPTLANKLVVLLLAIYQVLTMLNLL